jgi:hypothetical protein
MPLPVRAASTVETSLGGHSSQSGAVAPTLAPTGAEAAPVRDPLLVVAGVAMPVLAGAFEVLAPSTGVVVEMLAEPNVLAPPNSGEAAVVGEPVVTPRLLLAGPSCNEAIEPPGSTVVVVDPDVAAVVVGDAARLLAGEPMVWARAAPTTQHRQSSAERRADRFREVRITNTFARGCHGPNGV